MGAKRPSIQQSFTDAYPLALQKIERYAIQRIADFGKVLLRHARDNKKGWKSFTGNTITSFAFGIYKNGSLTDTIFVDGVNPPIHRKIYKEESVTLDKPYEGESRTIKGKVDIRHEWGEQTSIETLRTLRPVGGNGIIVTTGTEWSSLLESKPNFNVLSDTELFAEVEGLKWMRVGIKSNISIDKL